MPDIVLGPIKTTDEEVQLFQPSDPYYYEVDNRPLRNLISNDQVIYEGLTQVVNELNAAKGDYDTLATRLDDIQAQINAAAGPAYLIGSNSEPFTFDSTNNVLKVKVDNDTDWQTVTFPVGTLTADQVVSEINAQTSGIDASVTTAGRVKIASQTVGTDSRIFVASVADGSTANPVLGFDAEGESTDFSTLEGRVSAIEEEIIEARFLLPTLADFLAVSHNPDGTIKDGAISFTATTVRNITLSGIRRQDVAPGVLYGLVYNTFYDSDRGLWVDSPTVQATSWYHEAPGEFRGDKKPFPKLSSMQLFEDKLVITDRTDPTTTDLWMQFNITPLWVLGQAYSTDDTVARLDPAVGVRQYRCIEAHTADANNEPGVGVDWPSYWVEITDGTALFGKPVKVAVQEARLVVATEDVGLFVIDFVADQITWFSQDGRRVFNNSILARNSANQYGVLHSQFALTTNRITDVAISSYASKFAVLAGTVSGLNVVNYALGQTVHITNGGNSSVTAVAALGSFVVFSMGPIGSESDVYTIDDIYGVATSGSVDDVADRHFGAHTVPAFDTYPTTTLDVATTSHGVAILRGSSHGFKVIYNRASVEESWAAYFQQSRDATFFMKGDVRGMWAMDMDVAPDEPVDDLSHNQYPLIAKGQPFTVTREGAVGLYQFNGTTQYLINGTDVSAFSFGAGESMSLMVVIKPTTIIDSTILAKWNDSVPAREWKLAIEGGKLKFIVFDEANDAEIYRESTLELEPNRTYFVQVGFTGSTDPNDIKIYVDGVDTSGAVGTIGTFVTMQATSAPLTVGANIIGDGSVSNHFTGYIGATMICATEIDDEWLEATRGQVDRWRNVTTNRLAGSTNRVVSVSASPMFNVAYVGTGDNGAVTRVSLVSSIILNVWSHASGTTDDLGNVFANDNIHAVFSGGSIRLFTIDDYVWFEMDPLDLRAFVNYLGDFGIDGIVLAGGATTTTTTSTGGTVAGAQRVEVYTVTLADESNGYITLSTSPADPATVQAFVVGGGVLLNQEAAGAVLADEDPDFVIHTNKLVFKNGVTDGPWVSSGLSEDVGVGDTIIVVFTA